MSSEQVFYITRIVLTSLCHGITLTILAREGGKGHRALITMGTMTLIITALGSFFVFLFPSQASHVSSTAYMMLIVMGIMFCLVSTGSPLTERLFIYITYVAVFMLMVGFSSLLATLFFSESLKTSRLAIRTVLSAILIVMLKLFLRDKIYEMTDGLSVHGVEITMFSWVLGLGILAYVLFSAFFISSPFLNLMVLFFLTFLYVTLFLITIRIVRLATEEVEMEKIQSRSRLLESELEAERAFVERAKAIRHDQRHHDRIILEYLNSGDISRAKEYLGSHDCSLASEALESWCQNPLLDAQLRIAKRYCLRNDIEFSVDVNLPGALDLNEIDFVSVIANLLENAIEAAVSSYKPYVSISLRRANNRMLLEIRNTFSSQQGVRKNKESSGEGLPSVRMILERNEGLLQQVVDGNVFISRVILPVKD